MKNFFKSIRFKIIICILTALLAGIFLAAFTSDAISPMTSVAGFIYIPIQKVANYIAEKTEDWRGSFVSSSVYKDKIEELTLTGKLNTFDFDFIKTMSNLKLLDMSSITNTTLPASCLANSTITTVLLPLSLTAIPNRAFYQAAITSIYIPETVQTIGEYAFYQCKSIAGNLVIPDATTSIGNYCFQECTFNGTLTLGAELQTIGKYAFSQCIKFHGDLIIPDKVTTLGQYAFNECVGFTGNLVIGDSVTAINSFTFFKCSNLAGNLTISTNATIVDEGAFAYCSKLTGNLIIPDKVTSIGYGAFWECSGFTGYLLLGKSITSIGIHAFTKDGGRVVRKEDSDYWYSYTLQLNFSRVYCKATSLPKIVIGEISYYDSDDRFNDGYEAIDIWHGFDSYGGVYIDPERKGGTFRDNRDKKLPNLIVPTRTKSLYEANNDWNSTFALIEGTDF